MDAIFNLYKVRFNTLDELFDKSEHSLREGDTVNVYINLEMVMKTLMNRNVEQYVQVRETEKHHEFIANVLNLLAHYRLFFTKNRLHSRLFLYVNDPESTKFRNEAVIPEYRQYYKDRFTIQNRTSHFVRLMRHTLVQIETIIDYVEDAYFIRTRGIEPSLIPYMVMQDSNKVADLHFLVSNDRYDYQYVLHNAFVLRPRKENSYMVTRNNLWRIAKMEEKIVNDVTLPEAFYPAVLSLIGDKYRNIPGIRGYGLFKVMDAFRRALDTQLITESMSNVYAIANPLNEAFRNQMLQNYFAVDLKTQYLTLSSFDKEQLTKRLINRFDNLGLTKINEQYFTEHPIMLLELTSKPMSRSAPKPNLFD